MKRKRMSDDMLTVRILRLLFVIQQDIDREVKHLSPYEVMHSISGVTLKHQRCKEILDHLVVQELAEKISFHGANYYKITIHGMKRYPDIQRAFEDVTGITFYMDE